MSVEIPGVPRGEALRRVLVVTTKYKPQAFEHSRELERFLKQRGIDAVMAVTEDADLRVAAGGCDLVVAVGGDGTILGLARKLHGVDVPVVGLNIGKLGFLAEFTMEEFRRYVAGDAVAMRVVPRLMLRCSCGGEKILYALNDAIITQGPMTRLLDIEMSVDAGPVTMYNADGIVVSTPVGSTAYSLSLGGPILTPGARNLIVTPISAHSLTNRPLVLEDTSVLTFRVTRGSPSLSLVMDGQEIVPLEAGSEIVVRAAEKRFYLTANADRSFFELLRAKFHWGAPPNYALDRSSR